VRKLVAGLDGCRAGWVMATVPAAGPTAGPTAGATAGPTAGAGEGAGPGDLRIELVTDLGTVVRQLEEGRLTAAAIDIPIGLAPDAPRPVDAEARRSLGPRKSSVFPAPVRPVLAAQSYADACAISRAACGRAISRQLFNILGKIREVDALQSPSLQDRLFEMHPELSFTHLAGAPMRFHKATEEGRRERLDALRREFGDLGDVARTRPRGSQPDDVLDAVVGAWTARRYVARTHIRLGGELDQRGLRMEIIA